jgi:PAS domain S-box-containing protein
MDTAISEAELQYWNIFESASDGIIIIDLKSCVVLAANPAAFKMHGFERETFCGQPLQRFLHANSLRLFDRFVQVIQTGGLFGVVAQHLLQDDSIINVEWRAVALKYQNSNCALALLRDVSKRVQADSNLKRRMKERAHEQTALLEISRTLASTLELQPGLILDQLRLLVNYSHACRFSLEDLSLIQSASRGMDQPEDTTPIHVRLKDYQALEALFNRIHPTRISDIWASEPSALFLRTLFEKDSAVLLEGVKSWMWVPMAIKNRFIGIIGIAHSERNYYTQHDTELAMTIANMASVALENSELYKHAQALAALQERQRLAQNLHDAVNQSLFSAGLIAEVLPRLWEIDLVETQHSLEDLRRLIRGAMAEMRALLAELRPATLTDSELGELLLLLGNAFTGRTNIPVDVTVSGESRFPAEIQIAFYRICQEALNNIAKHAKANKVEIDMNHTPLGLELHIRDNGRGFDTSVFKPSGHYGLKMMKERAEAAGANLTITSQPDLGTEITVCWGEQED